MTSRSPAAVPIVRVVRLSDVAPATIPIPPHGTPRPTWGQLVALEPRLAELAAEIRARGHHGKPPATFCANCEWYGYRGRGVGYKAQLCALVGWTARTEDPTLRSSRAYEIAYAHCYDLLPDCGPGCVCTVLLRAL